MGSISVYDDFKQIFRPLDDKNFNDDLIVGTLFFTRAAILSITKYFRIVGYLMVNKNGEHYPIDIRENDIAMLEGTYNCLPSNLKKELVSFNMHDKPQKIWSAFFFKWQFACDWNAFESSGSFIKLASIINGNEQLLIKIINDKIDIVYPSNYRELSMLVCNLKRLFEIEFYSQDYRDDVNYFIDSLINGYHINMTSEEVDIDCYRLCNVVLDKIGENHE